ncbi:putative prolyl 4-hydroxylase 3, partial [Cucurbita argyrosperma subsp. sororia]
MAVLKGKYIKFQGRKWSTFKLSKIVMALLLALGISMFIAFRFFSPTESSHSNLLHRLASVQHRAVHSDGLGKREDQWVEFISWEPRAFVYHNFLSKEECLYLISLATPYMKKSTVVDIKTGKIKDSRTRTSSGMFLNRGQNKIVSNIEKRIADFTFIPVEHGEALQILHYEVGQKYDAHYDFISEEFIRKGGQRIATLLMYLSDVEEGGETVFPAAEGNFSSLPGWNELSECGKGGLSVKPKMGDALLFWTLRPNNTLDPTSLHGACPVIRGNKWSCTKWMHGRFEIVSLCGSYVRADTGGKTGGLSVCLSSADGYIIGGGVGGPLKAAGPVQVNIQDETRRDKT